MGTNFLTNDWTVYRMWVLTQLQAVQGIESSLILSKGILYCVSGWPFIEVVSFLACDNTSSNIEQAHKSQWHLCLPEYSCSCITTLKQCRFLRYNTSGLLHCVIGCVASDIVMDHSDVIWKAKQSCSVAPCFFEMLGSICPAVPHISPKTESHILGSFSIRVCAEVILWLFESLSDDRNITV
jgi:hypothetical protein